MPLQVKRVYAAPHRDDGFRILVDRLWPRGLTKEDAAVDQWIHECAPSDALRKWFGHDRAKWKQFKQKYFAELRAQEDLLAPIRALAKQRRVTLLFGASDTECNNAVALIEYLTRKEPSIRRRKPTPNNAGSGRARKRLAAKGERSSDVRRRKDLVDANVGPSSHP